MAIKKKDFIEINYTGKVKEGELIFDTTDEKLAKEADIHNPKMKYGPIVICVGEAHLIKGLDDKLVGKEPGKYTFDLKPEEAFGKKTTDLIQMIPTKKFTEHNIQPMPGLQVNIDGALGIIKTVSGGRTLVDFNHPLAGKEIVYDIEIIKTVTDKKLQVNSILSLTLNIDDAEITITNEEAKIKLKKALPKEVQTKTEEKIKELTGLKKAEFSTEKPEQGPKKDLNSKKESV